MYIYIRLVIHLNEHILSFFSYKLTKSPVTPGPGHDVIQHVPSTHLWIRISSSIVLAPLLRTSSKLDSSSLAAGSYDNISNILANTWSRKQNANIINKYNILIIFRKIMINICHFAVFILKSFRFLGMRTYTHWCCFISSLDLAKKWMDKSCTKVPLTNHVLAEARCSSFGSDAN